MSSYYLGTGQFGKDWILIPAILVILAAIAIPQLIIAYDLRQIYRQLDKDMATIHQQLLKQGPVVATERVIAGTTRYRIDVSGKIDIQFDQQIGDHSEQHLVITPKYRHRAIQWHCSPNVRHDLLENQWCFQSFDSTPTISPE